MKCLQHSGVFCLYIYIYIYIYMHACRGFFFALAVFSVIIQLFISASSLNGGFTIGQRPHSNGITPFVFSTNIFNGERGDTGPHFYILRVFTQSAKFETFRVKNTVRKLKVCSWNTQFLYSHCALCHSELSL